MARGSLKVFCTPTELSQWVGALLTEKDLVALTFPMDADRPPRILADVDLTGSRRAFIIPREAEAEAVVHVRDIGDARARERGWLDVRPGQMSARLLLLSEILAEDGGTGFAPSKWLKWLKKHIRDSIQFGVRGTNVVTGGEHVYKDIGFTNGALRFREAQGVWRQHADGRVEFEPVVSQGRAKPELRGE